MAEVTEEEIRKRISALRAMAVREIGSTNGPANRKAMDDFVRYDTWLLLDAQKHFNNAAGLAAETQPTLQSIAPKGDIIGPHN